jgi:hypothetical protein
VQVTGLNGTSLQQAQGLGGIAPADAKPPWLISTHVCLLSLVVLIGAGMH